jgi:hypothetical protein
MTMQKGTKNAMVCEAVAIARWGVSGSFPAFFLPIATTSNKNFKSEVIGNWKCRCCEVRGEGHKTRGLLCALSAFLLHKTRDTPSRVNREVSKSFDMNN